MVSADDFNILCGSVHVIKKNTESLAVRSKEMGTEVNADKTKYIVMSRDQNAGRSHNMKIDNISFESWNSSNVWEQPRRIKMPFRKKLRAD